MKMKIFAVIVYFVVSTPAAWPGTERPDRVWNKVPGVPASERLTSIAWLRTDRPALFLGTDRSVYRSDDHGRTWRKVFTTDGEFKVVNEIYIYNDSSIYLSTGNGIYKSVDNGDSWEKILKWKLQRTLNIRACVIDKENDLYVLTDTVLYRKTPDGENLERFYAAGVPEDPVKTSYSGEEPERSAILNHVTIDDRGTLYLSTNRGILRCVQGKTVWERVENNGLLNESVNSCFVDNGVIYAATAHGAFVLDPVKKEWRSLYKGAETIACNGIAVDSLDPSSLWCVSDKALYTTVVPESGPEWHFDFSNEPAVKDVQNMAVRYAEVSPEKIKKWRKEAKLRAVLPRVSVGLDHSTDDNCEIYTSATTHYTVNGPKDNSDGWDLTLSWELGDLIYSDSQTSIDSRSKLMVELRNDILTDVTRLYFERRRLEMELLECPADEKLLFADKKLRVEELTASLDAYTGGWFSEALDGKR